MIEVEQRALLLDDEKELPFVSEIDLGGEDADFSSNFRNIYEAKGSGVASVAADDTEQVKRIRQIYKVDGADIEDGSDDDDEEDDQKVKAIAKPNYSAAQSAEKPPSDLKRRTGVPEYLSSGSKDMSSVSLTRNSAYVCVPGSKGACGTCPVYSLMAKPGVAERLDKIRADNQIGNRSYVISGSRLTPQFGAGVL